MQSIFERKLGRKIKPFCIPGNSNDRIIRSIKEQIILLTDGLKTPVTNVYFNIQFTYLNRIYLYSDLESKWIPFHSPNVLHQPFGTKNDECNIIYNQFYADWLTYFFNEEVRLNDLLTECRIIKNLMETFGIKYTWYLWSGSNNPEVVNAKKSITPTNHIYETQFEELGFQKWDEFWYFDDYATKNGLRNCDQFGGNDTHVSANSNNEFFNTLFGFYSQKIFNI
jgi:hypothetical protein